jgi:hypothetical protein
METIRRLRRARTVIAAVSAMALLAGCSTAAAAYHSAPSVTVGSNEQLHALPHSPTMDESDLTKRHRRKRRPQTTTTTVPILGGTVPGTTVGTESNYGPCTASSHPVGVGPVTVIGDSVTMDFEPCLADDISDVNFDAFVGQQWYQGVADVSQLRSQGQLGSTVVIALGTNGPVSSGDFAAMMDALHGVSRVVFVTNYVNESWTDWQDSNNQVIESGVAHYPNTVVADWCALAEANPEWFTPNGGPHVGIGGAAAAAAAQLIASKL